jgi:L-iditol 2-dehydrogenase
MKIAYFTALRELEIIEAPPPKLERSGDVLLRVDRVGICGSDVHYYLEGHIGNQALKYPATVGHECAGTVLEVGSAVTRLRAGDRVAVDPAIVCGTCDQCRAGRSNTCRNLQFMGCPGEAPGAVAELCVLPAACCVPVPDGMSLDVAALVEPLSIGLHAVRLAQPASGARIAVLGSGPIGLCVLLCAKALAPCTVHVTDLLDERLAVAQRCGADATNNARQAEAAKEMSPDVDVVFECSGDPACIDQGLRLLAPGGTLIMVGIPLTDEIRFDPHRVRRLELTMKGVRRQNDCVAPAIRLVSEGRLDPRPLLTHRYPLAQITEAFELVAGYRDGVVKAILDLDAGVVADRRGK